MTCWGARLETEIASRAISVSPCPAMACQASCSATSVSVRVVAISAPRVRGVRRR